MATASTTTVIDHSGDAGFRAWVAEFIAQLIAVGLTQTADTGQINTGTATRPATSTNGGYAIFRFNDTLHGTVPIFIRFDFGTDSGAGNPRIQVTVGSATNGSGTLTGILGQRAMTTNAGAGSTVTSYVSRFCYNATYGFLGVAWKIGGPGTEGVLGMLFIGRTTDSNGDPTNGGVYMIGMGNTIGAVSSGGGSGALSQQLWNASTGIRWPTDAQIANAPFWGMWPHAISTTQVGSDTFVVPGFYATPGIDTHAHLGICLRAEIPPGNTISLALKGASARTFISVGYPGNTGTGANFAPGNPNSIGLFMLWE